MSKASIATSLLQQKMITEEELFEAKEAQQKQGGRLGEILIGMGALTEEQFQHFLAQRYHFGYLPKEHLQQIEVEDSVLELLSYKTALQHLILPLKVDSEKKTLTLCSLAPLPDEILRPMLDTKQLSKPRYYLATRQNLLQAIRYHYGQYMKRQAESESTPFTDQSPPSKVKTPSKRTLTQQKNDNLIEMRREGFCPSCGFPCESTSSFCPQCGTPLNEDGDPLLGQVLEGTWKLISQIGEGGMGLIYEGVHIETQQRVAVKILRTQFKVNEQVIDRFYNEVQILRRLRHPNILEVYGFGYEERTGFFLVMELLQGCSYEEYLKAHQGEIRFEALLEIVTQVCDGMEYAHKQHIIHRDLKPDNIFLLGGPERIDQIKILDFGVAKIKEGEQKGITQVGFVLGTPRYFSPEQAQCKPIDHRSDIYALAVILFETLTGRELFQADNPYEYLMRHGYTTPPTLSVARKDRNYPKGLEELINQALSKDPKDRPANLTELKERFLEIMQGQTTIYQPNKTLQNTPETNSRFQHNALDVPSPFANSQKPITNAGFQEIDYDENESPTAVDFWNDLDGAPNNSSTQEHPNEGPLDNAIDTLLSMISEEEIVPHPSSNQENNITSNNSHFLSSKTESFQLQPRGHISSEHPVPKATPTSFSERRTASNLRFEKLSSSPSTSQRSSQLNIRSLKRTSSQQPIGALNPKTQKSNEQAHPTRHFSTESLQAKERTRYNTNEHIQSLEPTALKPRHKRSALKTLPPPKPHSPIAGGFFLWLVLCFFLLASTIAAIWGYRTYKRNTPYPEEKRIATDLWHHLQNTRLQPIPRSQTIPTKTTPRKTTLPPTQNKNANTQKEKLPKPNLTKTPSPRNKPKRNKKE